MQDISSEEINRVLETAPDGMLGLCDNGRPYCIPLGFVWTNDTLYLSLFPTGRKWGCLQNSREVCFSVYIWNADHTRWSSVIIEGELAPVDDLSEIELVIRANIVKMGLQPEAYLAKRMDYYRTNMDNPRGLKNFKIIASSLQGRSMATQMGK
ncbi:MAG: pyridoxamine 5'-phosphate oxidase family protein [Proteobacteria bacterium]|nr:pyridoxamine 5'-phosphate oxidase family protein [Pseudomonadota bacterium]